MKHKAKLSAAEFEKLQDDIQNHRGMGDAAYYELLNKFLPELIARHDDENSTAVYLLACINKFNAQAIQSDAISNQYDYDLLQMLNISKLDESTLVSIYEKLFQRTYTFVTYSTLCYLRKLLNKLILKDEQTSILRRLQSLISPLDKKCVKVVIGIIVDIVGKWNTDSENKELLRQLLALPKWGKLEYYVCKAVFEHVDRIDTFKDILSRIVSGFRENYTAHSAYVLLQHILSQNAMMYLHVLLDVISDLLSRPHTTYNKTMNSSLVTYLIPVARCEVIQLNLLFRCYNFSPYYRLHTLRYYYMNQLIDNIDPEVLLLLLRKNPENQALLQLVWEIACVFPAHNTEVSARWLDFFIKLLQNHYKSNIPNISGYIKSFISHVAVAWCYAEWSDYEEFYLKIADTIFWAIEAKNERPGKTEVYQGIFQAYIFSLALSQTDYTYLKLKYPIPERLRYTVQTNPLRSIRETIQINIIDLIKFSMDIEMPLDTLCDVVANVPFSFDNSAKKFIQYSVLVSCTSPNFDNMQKIQTYTKSVTLIYQSDEDLDMLAAFRDELQSLLNNQFSSISYICTPNAILTNPIYSTAEALCTLVKEAPRNPTAFYEALIDTTDSVLTFVIENREKLFDNITKKAIEYIFVNVLNLMYSCVEKMQSVKNKQSAFPRLFEQCQNVILKSQLRKATTNAYKLLTTLIVPLRVHLTVDELVSTLDVQLKSIESRPLNRWTGVREMILISFKLLSDKPAVFRLLIEKMLYSPTGNHECHMRALEVVLKESCFKELTNPSVIPILEKILQNLTHVNYKYRNASCRLLEIIASRLLGVKSEMGNRPISMHHAFERSPKLLQICEDAFISHPNSRFGVLCLLAEASYNPSIFGESYELSPTAFQHLFEEEGKRPFCSITALACANSINAKLLISTIEEKIDQSFKIGSVTNMQLLTLRYLMLRFYTYRPPICSKDVMVNISTKYKRLLNCLSDHREYDDVNHHFNLIKVEDLPADDTYRYLLDQATVELINLKVSEEEDFVSHLGAENS